MRLRSFYSPAAPVESADRASSPPQGHSILRIERRSLLSDDKVFRLPRRGEIQ